MQETITQAIVVIMGLLVTMLGLAIPYLLWRYGLFTFTFVKEEPVLAIFGYTIAALGFVGLMLIGSLLVLSGIGLISSVNQ